MSTPTTSSGYLAAIASFAAGLRPDAERLDAGCELMADRYKAFCDERLNTGWSWRQPLTGREFCEAIAALAAYSGAFAFVAMQQFVANAWLPGDLPGDAWPRLGVAYGHLRNPRGPAPVCRAGLISGTVPWMSGAGIFEQVVLGYREPDGSEVYALARADSRPCFRHQPVPPLVAGSGTCTVSVRAENLSANELTLLRASPRGTQAHKDALSIIYQTPLMVGCVRACLEVIEVSDLVPADLKSRCADRARALIARVLAAFESGTPPQGAKLRAEIGDFSVRIARLAAMSCGGRSLLLGHPAQRLYREALLYSLMAQTEQIVDDAFAEVFS